ncbi:MAG: UDP-N-acetylmuramoyl-L-alanine--D-glutamate ligase [Chthoniobacterales bacterium]|nr:UDP-N-acetylmuramoyl-L-alanine--D-glutamate ligase [Chthoniobacterales bacterium]
MKPDYRNKNVAVLGAGRSGKAAALLLAEEGARVTMLDSAPEEKLVGLDPLRAKGVYLLCGPAANEDPVVYDLGVLSPGIDPELPLARNFSRKNIPAIGELELGWQFCRVPVIGITGTNGKTTTTELISQMLNACGQRTVACGNIGKPLVEAARERDDLDVLTVEVSSFQLETIREFHPEISVWLNFAPDHLDRYPSIREYREGKLRIFKNQTADDTAVVNVSENLPAIAPRITTFSAWTNDGDFSLGDGWIVYRQEPVLQLSEAHLSGPHNAENMMAALAVGRVRGLSFGEMVPPLCAYRAQLHRLEFIREIGGIDYVNDSKATNLDALEKALLSATKPIVLIAGGKDKGFAFDSIAPLVREKVRVAILIGEIAGRVAEDWKSATECEVANSLGAAVESAHAVAQKGETVLFSPGTSSFDMFKSYADRGDQFRALVRGLPDSSL